MMRTQLTYRDIGAARLPYAWRPIDFLPDGDEQRITLPKSAVDDIALMLEHYRALLGIIEQEGMHDLHFLPVEDESGRHLYRKCVDAACECMLLESVQDEAHGWVLDQLAHAFGTQYLWSDDAQRDTGAAS